MRRAGGLTLLVGPELAHGKRGPQTAKTAYLRGQGDGSGTCPWPASGLCLCGLLLALELQSCPTRTHLCPPPTQLEAQALWVTVSVGRCQGELGSREGDRPTGPIHRKSTPSLPWSGWGLSFSQAFCRAAGGGPRRPPLPSSELPPPHWHPNPAKRRDNRRQIIRI